MSASESIFIERTPGRPLKGSLHRQALGPATAIVESRNGPKNQSIRGAKWLPLGTSLPSFFVRRKKVADRPDFCCGMSAHKERNPAERDIECAATSFFPRRKKDAKTPPGFPRTPDGQPVFFSGKPAGTASPEPTPIQQGGPGPPGLDWARGRKKTATPSPGAATPFCI